MASSRIRPFPWAKNRHVWLCNGSLQGLNDHSQLGRYRFQQRGDVAPLLLYPVRVPNIKNQDNTAIHTVVPHFMIDAVVKGPDLTPHDIAALFPHPETTACGHYRWQVADHSTIQQPGMRIDSSSRLKLGEQHRRRKLFYGCQRQDLHAGADYWAAGRPLRFLEPSRRKSRGLPR